MTLFVDSLSSNRPVFGRPVLGRDEMLGLGHRFLELMQSSKVAKYRSALSQGVRVEHITRSVTKIVNGRVSKTEDGSSFWIVFKSSIGTDIPAYVGLQHYREASFGQILAALEAATPPSASAEDMAAEDPDEYGRFKYGPQQHSPVNLWHDPTARALTTAKDEVFPQLAEQMRVSGLSGAATVGLSTRSVLYLYKHGLNAFAEETDSEITLTARAPDRNTSGWSGQASRDWSTLNPGRIAEQARDIANRAQNPVALEPGRRVAILGPAAVAQMVVAMAPLFDLDASLKKMTPFSYFGPESGRQTKIGQRVVDPRIVMESNPADPMGGFPPFFEFGGVEADVYGYPVSAVTWIEGGMLRRLAASARAAVNYNIPACDWPTSVHLKTVPGTQTSTIEEMISNCREGVYVNRFSDVELINPKSGIVTGTTRDGCFFIKNGKIEKSIKNFRFIDSPIFALNSWEMVGRPERVAFGYSTTRRSDRFPQPPVIVPPMMVRDFNFSALSDAI